MSADSCVTPWVASVPPGSPLSQVAAARRLLIALLTSEQSDCATAITTLGAGWLKQHGLAPSAWHAWRGSGLSDELATVLRTAYFTALADDLLHRYELQAVLQTLAAQDIVPVVFKGAALAYTVYADSACRSMGDIDLWIAPEDLPRAQAALEAHGYRLYYKPDRPPVFKELHGAEIQLAGQAPGSGLVELHGGVFVGDWIYSTARVDETAVWARTTSARLLDQPVCLLAPEDAVLQQLVHTGINHQFSMSVLRGLIDVALLARSVSLDWTVVADRARSWRIATVTWLGLVLAIDLAGLSEARSIMPRLAPSRWRQACLKRLVNAERIVKQADLRISRLRFVLLIFLVDRKRDAVHLIFRALWPEREWLIARYGRYTFSTRLRHLFDAARGRI